MTLATPEYIYFFSRLFKSESHDSTNPDKELYKPFMINQWFIYHSTDTHNMVSMVRDTPFTVPIENGQKFRYQLVRWKTNPTLPANQQIMDYYPKIKEIMETKYISPSFVHSKGFEILADFIYTADETNPVQNYQGFQIQFKYCIIPKLNYKEDTDNYGSYEEQLYMTHPSFIWPK